MTLQGGAANLGSPPPGWLELERTGDLVRLIATQYGPETERACRERFPTGAFAVQAMTLREIFIALARAGRNARKGAAA